MASLTPVSLSADADQEAPLPINADEIVFGRDPALCTWVIDDPSLEAIHARLRREGETFRLLDEGTTAGTWINYSPVPETGALLEHSDLIHIGRASFRFILRSSGKTRKPVIYTPEQRRDPY
jgi:predicted component of type VI protein secretion system